ncbi:translocation/assembly module TamB domain-containing protein [Bartonella sp. CB175]|uniref:translocation/assembly module TamB domain-containing protein n=1 Tax=Bartonella sp. CB175 TaxID=3112256 RepID=UPI00300E4FE6
MKKIGRFWIFLFVFVLFMGIFVLVQRGTSFFNEMTEDDNSWLASFIERKLSAPNRQIHLYDIRGALSSQLSIGAITVSDKKGVWLKIDNAKIDWNRLALLRGNVEINHLSIEQITFLRKSQGSSLVSSVEEGKFSLPKLPVSIFVNTFVAKHVALEQNLFGFFADLSLQGHLTLANGDLDADIKAHRLDKPGSFSIMTKISNSNRIAKIDISADEPQNGIVANILNIEKHPALNLTVKGDGTFDDLVVKLHLEADHHPILDGDVVLASISEGHSLSTKLVGKLGLFMPTQYRSLFESDITLTAEGRMTKEGVTHLDNMVIQGQAVNIIANAKVTADGFLRQLFIDGKIALDKESSSTPVLGTSAYVDNLALTIDYGREGQQSWKGRLTIHNLGSKNIHVRDAVFDMGGVSENLDDIASRHVGIQINGTLEAIKNTKEASETDLSQTVHVHLDTDIVSKKSVLIHDFSVTAQGFSAWLKGKMNHFVFTGNLGLKARTLAHLGLLSERTFSGGADIKAKGNIGLMSGAFDLELSGMTNNLKIGMEPFDRLFKGNLTLSGGAAWNTMGLVLHHLYLKNQYTSIKANGYFSRENAKMDLTAQISDLAMLDPRMRGALTIQSRAKGSNSLIKLKTRAQIVEAFLVEKKLQNTTFNLNVLIDNTSPITSYLTGSLKGQGTFAEKPLRLSASFKDSNQIRYLQNISIRGGNAEITGNLSQPREGFLKGFVHIDADDISALAALFLQEGSGKIKGDFIFNEYHDRQKANLKVDVDHLSFAKNKIKKLAAEAHIFDPFGTAQFEGFVKGEQIQTPLVTVNRLNVFADHNDEQQTAFTIQTLLHDNTNVQLSGHVITMSLPEGIKREVQIKTMGVKQHNLHAALPKPATIIFDKNGMMISDLGFSVNGGKIMLAGSFYDTLNLHLTMDAFPVSLVNLWKPSLGASGTLTGQVMIRGNLKKPNVSYDIKGEGITTAAFQDKKIMPFTFSATGKTVNQLLTLNSDLTGEGIQAQAQGSLSLEGQNSLDLHINLQNLSTHLANGFIEGKALGGMVVGKVDISGTVKDPSAHFELSSHSMNVITHKGLISINMNAHGFYKKSTLHIDNMIATGDKGLDLSMNGAVALSGSEAKLNVKGKLPLAFFDLLLAKRGTNVTGMAKIDTTINGSLFKPQLIGHFSIVDGGFFDSQTNFGLNNITLEGKLNGDRILIEKASASSFSGGAVSVSGHITNDLQTDLLIYLDHANYNDGSTVVATLSGKVKIAGYFLGDLVIGGDINVEKAEVVVPDHFLNTRFLDVKNKNLTKPIRKTLERADVKSYKSRNIPQESSSVVRLNMNIMSRNQFFVRGRGLDTELGGRINLTGPLNDVHPVGEFQMIRGRFDILSKRLNFDQGHASFSGNLNPTVYFVTNNNSDNIRVTVIVSGTIDDLDINFSSQPNLPQDEILARLIFNRSLSELSPFQIAQLAAAAANLVGASNTSLWNALRAKIGLDDLDVVVDEKGNTGLRIGRYIHNNIYLGFEAESDGTTKGTINLDISRNLKAKGAIGNEKNSSVGLFYEKDY